MTFYERRIAWPQIHERRIHRRARLVESPTRSGYKVVFVPFVDGRPAGLPEDVLTGFVDDDGDARGRPVGVAIDRTGALSSPTTSATSSGG